MPTDSPHHVAIRPALWAGVVASIVFQALEIVLIPLVGGGSPWGPMRMIAAMVLGRSVLPPPDTFNLGVALVALVVDIVLAVVYAFPLAWLIEKLDLGRSAVIGAGFGLALYLINFHGLTAIFPGFILGRNAATVVTHVVFSVVVVVVYKTLQAKSPVPAVA